MRQFEEAVIKILIETNSQAEAMDCISEALRPLLNVYNAQSSVIDWQYVTLPAEPMAVQEYEHT